MPFSEYREIRLDPSGSLQAQLYEALLGFVQNGRWTAGTRLASSRQVASLLGISRNTVLAVYEQLKAEAIVTSRPGKGLYVAEDVRALVRPSLAGPTHSGSLDRAAMPRPRQPTKSPLYDSSLPFTPGLPDLSHFPLKSWNRVLHHQEGRRRLLGYDQPQGYEPLRGQICEYLKMARGVRCQPHQVIVTSGAQQALALIADVFLDKNDTVLHEDPGYRGVRRALAGRGVTVEAVPLRQQAIDVSQLPEQTSAKLLYCTPTHQYPMGGILSYPDRLRLLEWARRTGTWLVEDDYDSEFHFSARPIPALQGLEEETPVLYIGSFSKTLFPALRLGYLVAPEHLLDALVAAKHQHTGESPLLNQAVVSEFMASGQFGRHVRRMRQVYQEKWLRFHELLTARLPESLNVVAEGAGMHVVVTGLRDDLQASERLREAGLGSAPLSDHCLRRPAVQGLVLGFASAGEEAMKRCLSVIADW